MLPLPCAYRTLGGRSGSDPRQGQSGGRQVGPILVLCLLAGGGRQPRPPSAELGAEPNYPAFIVHAEIGGKDARFLIDSGSPEVRVQPSWAARLGLLAVPANAADTLATALANSDVEGYCAYASLQLGGVNFTEVPILIQRLFADSKGKPVQATAYDGVIGLRILKPAPGDSTPCMIGWPCGRVEISPPSTRPPG